jgi:hypothetical protein
VVVELAARSPRGLLVIGASLLWVIGLLWTLQSGESAPLGSSGPSEPDRTTPLAAAPAQPPADEPVSEIQLAATDPALATSRPRVPAPSDAAALPAPPEPIEQAPSTYPLWFESERALGVCKVSYGGVRKTANLHVATRAPLGKLSFAWQCGKEGGRASIEVDPKQVNGVLFCKESGGVEVKTVRRKDARCGG